MQIKYFLPVIIVALVAAACKPEKVDNPPPPQVVALSISPVHKSIAPGTTTLFTAIAHFSNNTQRNLTSAATWSSSDAAIAVISNEQGSKGLATAATAGSTIISATLSGITSTTMLTASPVTQMTVTAAGPPSIAPGTSKQFSAMGTLQDNTVQNLTTWATWTSLNSSIAVVSNASGSRGLATAVAAPGTAEIQASFNAVPGAATLTTSPAASIAILPGFKSIPKGMSHQFIATGTLADGINQDLTTFATWTTTAPSIATISNSPGSRGLATAVDVGSTDVIADFNSIVSPPAAFTVTAAVLESITLTPAAQSIPLGKSQPFIATGHFSGNTTQDITSSVAWLSSNTSVATIGNTAGSKGLALSLAQGSTSITASLSGITSTAATLTVTPAELVSIIITPASASIPLWNTQKFSAIGIYTDNSAQDLTASVHWASSAPSVATISNTAGSKGTATPFLNGSTNITATFSTLISNTAVLTVTF